MSDLRIQPWPPETLAAQRPVVDPRPAAAAAAVTVPAASAGSGGSSSGNATNGDGAREQREQYVSPFISIDPTSGLVITQYRNSETGELQQQYPSAKVVREYRNLQPPAVTPSGGQPAPTRAPGQPAEPGGQPADVVTIGLVAQGAGPVPDGAATVPSPTPAPTPAPVPAATPATPAASTGGLDKGAA